MGRRGEKRTWAGEGKRGHGQSCEPGHPPSFPSRLFRESRVSPSRDPLGPPDDDDKSPVDAAGCAPRMRRAVAPSDAPLRRNDRPRRRPLPSTSALLDPASAPLTPSGSKGNEGLSRASSPLRGSHDECSDARRRPRWEITCHWSAVPPPSPSLGGSSPSSPFFPFYFSLHLRNSLFLGPKIPADTESVRSGSGLGEAGLNR